MKKTYIAQKKINKPKMKVKNNHPDNLANRKNAIDKIIKIYSS